MKNVLIGIAAGIAIGYVLRKMEDDGKFKCIHDDMSELADRTKRNLKMLSTKESIRLSTSLTVWNM